MKKVTSSDVAALAGVSQSTVSFVLNNRTDIEISVKTRARVIDAAKQLNYGPFAKDYASFGHNQAAVFIPTFVNPYYTTILSLITEELFKHGFQTILCCTNRSAKREEQLLHEMDTPTVESVIFTYTPLSRTDATAVAKRKRMFVIGEIDFPINAGIVTLNSRRAGYIVAQHLYELGHRRMAYITTPMNVLSISRKKRLEGIQDFAREVGLTQDIEIQAFAGDNSLSEFEIGYRETKNLLAAKPDITAIIGVNDFMALGILNALSDLHIRIPEDISVTGFDNISYSELFRPSLTSIDHMLRERTHHAIDLLVSDTPASQNIYITYDPVLIKRESTGAPRAGGLTLHRIIE